MNKLFFGDCLEVMREEIPDASVDLIYLDPPFNSKRIYNASMGGAQWEAFSDTWQWHEAIEDFHEVASDPELAPTMEGLRMVLGEGSSMAYLSYMANRLREFSRALKDTGSIYLHCDPTMSHYLKVVMDGVFGNEHFRNEIHWRRNESGAKGSQHSARSWGSNVDSVFFYTKGSNSFFNPLQKSQSPQDKRRLFPKVDSYGERYNTKMTAWRSPSMGPRPNLCYEFRGIYPPYPSGWRLSLERMEEEYAKGNIVIADSKLERRSYEKNYRGVSPGNLWADKELLLGAQSRERLGYPTQKPVTLLERIIQASSNVGDVVLDPFCGCGTTIHAAQNLDRQWIGIDICVKACQVIEQRLRDHFDSLWADVAYIGFPKTADDARELSRLDKFKFEKWAVSLTPYMEANKKQRGDGGIDGRGRLAVGRGKFIDLVSQAKGGGTNPSDIQAFNGARQQIGADLGIFTCFEDRVTTGMRNVAVNTGTFMEVPTIQIYTVEDFFEGRLPHFPR